MGLTIHYSLSLPSKTSPATVKKKLEALRQQCLDLPFKEIDNSLIELSGQACDFEQRSQVDELRWFLIQAGSWIHYVFDKMGMPRETKRIDKYLSVKVSPAQIFGFKTWPGAGCEQANIGLSTMPLSVKVLHRGSGKKMALKLRGGWKWQSFCKTQYANDPRCGGIENFLRCHLCVIAMLDSAQKLGFNVEVSDEGGYWKSRDLKALVQSIDEYDAFVAAFGGALKDCVGNDIESVMSGRPDYEKLEAKGVALKPYIAKLAALTAASIADSRQE